MLNLRWVFGALAIAMTGGLVVFSRAGGVGSLEFVLIVTVALGATLLSSRMIKARRSRGLGGVEREGDR